MRFVIGFVGLCLVSLASGDQNPATFYKKYLTIIETEFDQPQSFEVIYKMDLKADTGGVLSPAQVKNEPKVSWKAEKDGVYTLMMIDIDAYNTEKDKSGYLEFLHWLVIDIEGKDLTTGEVIMPYVGAVPKKGTGLHRYMFLVYKQLDKFRFITNPMLDPIVDQRSEFSSSKFAAKYNLGKPVTGGFFRAKFDETVPQILKSIDI